LAIDASPWLGVQLGLPSSDLGFSQNGSWILTGNIPKTSVPRNPGGSCRGGVLDPSS